MLIGQGHEAVDFGTGGEEACDLADFAYPAALAVGRGEVERAVMVDGVGYGSAMIANRCSASTPSSARTRSAPGLARSHSDSNVLCIGGKIIGSALALAVVETSMTTDFLADEPKYARRVGKAQEIAGGICGRWTGYEGGRPSGARPVSGSGPSISERGRAAYPVLRVRRGVGQEPRVDGPQRTSGNATVVGTSRSGLVSGVADHLSTYGVLRQLDRDDLVVLVADDVQDVPDQLETVAVRQRSAAECRWSG